MAYYAPITGYRPNLVHEEICRTIDEAEAHDKRAIVDELSGLGPEVIEKILTEGLTIRQKQLITMLIDFADDAKYSVPAAAPPTAPADAYAGAEG